MRPCRCAARAATHSWGPWPQWPRMERVLLTQRARVEGFQAFDQVDVIDQAVAELAALVRAGEIIVREDVFKVLASAPGAINMLYTGKYRQTRHQVAPMSHKVGVSSRRSQRHAGTASAGRCQRQACDGLLPRLYVASGTSGRSAAEISMLLTEGNTKEPIAKPLHQRYL